jgi:acetyl-CoA carboxylase carboxyl transferase subunit beta
MPQNMSQAKWQACPTDSLREKLDAIPDGLWTKCPRCQELLFMRELERNLKVCKHCQYHFRLTAKQRIRLLLDEGSFTERDPNLRTVDPLCFPEYDKTLARHQEETGLTEAAITGQGTVNGLPVSISVTDSHFLMGSMASVVGERITLAIERAIQCGTPMILVSGSGGGARMHEGLLALMQMAKTAGALARLQQARLMAIVLLTDPSMGGVLASWGSLGDAILAEPGAMIGFTGPRVAHLSHITGQPPNFQTAEFQLEHGMVDLICPRRELKKTIGSLLLFSGASPQTEKLALLNGTGAVNQKPIRRSARVSTNGRRYRPLVIKRQRKGDHDMYREEAEDTTTYKVVVNHEEQYSIWPAHKDNPAGWRDAGKQGRKEECLEYINEVWTDMRPLSLRKKMEEQARNG